eukprot:15226_1
MPVKHIQIGFLCVVVTTLLLWSCSRIMGKILNIERVVFSVSFIEAIKTNLQLTNLDVTLIKKLSHRISSDGEYRLKTVATPYFVIGIAHFSLLVIAVITEINHPTWWRRHLIEFDKETVACVELQVVAGIVLSTHLYDLIIRFSHDRVNKSVAIHHILTVIAASQIILGLYVPFATLYGLIMVGGTFPFAFFRAFRFEFSWKYPNLTRQLFKYLFPYYVTLLVINTSGQLFLIIYGGYILGKVSLYNVVSYSIAVVFWVYHDSGIVVLLKAYSRQQYENVSWYVDQCNESKSPEGTCAEQLISNPV